jgi:hypothetical protein
MSTKQQVLDSGSVLRDQLFSLSQDGNFSSNEREGFGRLHAFYHMTLERFFLFAAHGGASTLYDQPKMDADDSIPLGEACQPGVVQSQQPYYDAVHRAAASLKAVTGSTVLPLKRAPSA